MFGALAGLDEDETAGFTLTQKQVLAAGATQQRSPAGSPAQAGRLGDDDDVAVEEVDPYADKALESLRLAGRETLENENKALLHRMLLAHTRRTKAQDAHGVRVENHFSAHSAGTPTLNIVRQLEQWGASIHPRAV